MTSKYYEEVKEAFIKNNLDEFIQEDIIQNLETLQNIILEKNKIMNLTAITEEKSFIVNHWVDAFKAVKLMENSKSVLDVGTGGGIIAFACALSNKDLTVDCLDSTGKKITFIKETALKMNINNLNAICARAEDYIKDNREKYNYVIARAVASLPILSELCIPYIKVGGIFIAMKGKNGLEELNESQKAISELGCVLVKDDTFIMHDGENEIARHNFVVKKTKHTDAKYPRQYSLIVKKHL